MAKTSGHSRIGFIGLGKMGRPMCRKLAEAGHDLVLYDVNRDALAEASTAHGATGVENAAELASQVEAVVLSVPGEREVEDILFGPQGLVAGARRGLLVLDATTIGVAQSRAFAERAAQQHVDYLDTPVSIIRPVGGNPTLTFMVGGSPEAFERARPILACIGSNVRLIGPTGSGGAAKLLNQAIYVSYMTAFAEALVLGEGMGLAREPLLDVLGTSAAGIPNIVAKYDEIRGRSNNRFAIDSALRYLDLANEAFGDNFVTAPVLQSVVASLRAASQSGIGSNDLVAGRIRSDIEITQDGKRHGEWQRSN